MNSLPEQFNFAEHLFALNRARGDRIAYIDDQGTLSYSALEDRARRLAAVLANAGVRREERVLLLMLDTSDWPVAFLGCLYAGVVPVAVNTLLKPDDYAYMLTHCRAQAALVSGALLPVLNEALALAPHHEVRACVVSQPQGMLAAGAVDMQAAMANTPALAAPARTGPDEPGFWLYSSGSTGKPKGTVHTQGSLWWTAELYGKAVLGLTEKDMCFSAAKLYFAYGLGNSLTFPLSVGATVVLMAERPTPDATFERWTRHQPTVFFGAPTGFAGMLASPCLPAVRWRCACARRRARRCRPRSRSASRTISGATSSMALVRPRCCTSSCPTARAMCATALLANRCQATRYPCAAKTAARYRRARSATSTSRVPALR